METLQDLHILNTHPSPLPSSPIIHLHCPPVEVAVAPDENTKLEVRFHISSSILP